MKFIKWVVTSLFVALATYMVYYSTMATFFPSRVGWNQFPYDELWLGIRFYGLMMFSVFLAAGMLISRRWVKYLYWVGCCLIMVQFLKFLIYDLSADNLSLYEIVSSCLVVLLFASIGWLLHILDKRGLLT